MPDLPTTQRLFWRLIRAPEGAAAALAALEDRARLLPDGVDGWIRGDDRLGAVARLDVYGRMYFFRLLDCLIEDFPALHAVVGHERFHSLAADYLSAHPSCGPSLRTLGRSLAEFIERHPLGEERTDAFLADLARFEWALLEAFDASDAAPVAAQRLKDLPAERWPDLRLALAPSLRIVEAGAPVHELWAAATERRALPALAVRPTVLRIWREDLRVFHRPIDDLELAILRRAGSGERFAALCEVAATITGEGAASVRVAGLLQRWLADSLIVGFDASPRS
jgi:hypothetical protein